MADRSVQLSLDFQPGLTQQYRRIEECIAATVTSTRGGTEKIAGALDMAPSELSRRLNAHLPAKEGDANNRPLRVSDFTQILEETRDFRPIYWLIEKFLRDPEVARGAALQQIAVLMPSLLSLFEQAGIAVPGSKTNKR